MNPPPPPAGEAAVLAVFEVTVGKRKVLVAGCRVRSGLLDRRMKFRLQRNQETIWEGEAQNPNQHHANVTRSRTSITPTLLEP